jgi:hypothetical protein
MKRPRTVVGLGPAFLALSLAVQSPALAQPVPDHLKCYKIKDPQAKASYTADLGGLVAEPGCTIKVPAIMACVPASKTNITPPPPGGGGTGTPNAFGCYKIKCPRATLPALALNDQFGSRTVTPKTPNLLCAPAAPPTTITTSTTTTTTSTTTTTTTCSTGQSLCNGICVDTSGDSNNCGGCNNVCVVQGSVCEGGTCMCFIGQVCGTQCASKPCYCADTQNDPHNCGVCGTECSATAPFCSGGSCTCPADHTICGSFCVNTQSDPDNCGSCGTVCDSATPFFQVCARGSCCSLPGESCNSTHPCCPGHNSCHINLDGSGFCPSP